MRPRVVLALLVAFAAVPQAGGGESPLRPVRWQTLPDSVYDVCVGPDGRVWYELDAAGVPDQDDVEALKKRIAAEFATPAPHVAAARVVLFEPGGRVWFRGWGRAQRTLLGFDGKAWVRHDLPAERSLTGEAPGRGRGSGAVSNAFADGVAFFPDYDGVNSFDGRQWSYQPLRVGPRPGGANSRAPLLHVEPDGRGVVALLPEEKPVLWRWRAGKWTQAASPQPLGRFQRFAPAADGVWIFGMEHRLRFHPYNAEDPRLLANVIAALDSADAAVRDEATLSLLSMGPAVLPALERALEDEQRPQVIASLQRVMADLRAGPFGGRPGRGGEQSSRFGPYRLGTVHALEYLPDRTVLVAAETITRAPELNAADGAGPPQPPDVVKAGLVLLGADGVYRLLPVEDPATVTGWGWADGAGPVTDGRGLWVSPRVRENVPTRRVSLAGGKVTATVPDGRYRWLRAATADGTLFVATGGPSSLSVPLVAYRPGAPDDRRVLKPGPEYLVSGQGAAVARDGAVWAHRAGEGLVRFDGRRWAPAGVLKEPQSLQWIVPARDGQVLVKTERTYCLAGDGVQPLLGEDLRALVAAHRDRFVIAFDGTGAGNRWGVYAALAADKARNLWMLEGQKLAVLAGEKWVDPGTALRAAGSNGEVRFLSPVGDGSKVFVTDFDRFAALGDVRGDQVVFAAVPKPGMDDRVSAYLGVRDAAGGLWVSADWFRPRGQADWMRGQFTLRLTEKGVAASLARGTGRPVLADMDGNVWLAEAGVGGFGRTRSFRLYRDGAVAGTVPVSGAGERAVLFADKPGSVYAWTDLGLQHFTRPAGAGPAAYAPGTTYWVEGISRYVRHVEFSRKGYVVVTAEPALGERDFALYVIPLPE